ncbi:MAG: phosphate ABC transporter permease PtsA, partial [Burkholderiales bacterium]
MSNLYRRRLFVNRLSLTLSLIAMSIGVGVLGWILYTLAIKGFGAIGVAMFTQNTPPPGSEGGLLNAIFGSVLMVGIATLIAMPVGILAGIYLAEYGGDRPFANTVRLVNDILLSAPSIVIGLFIY